MRREPEELRPRSETSRPWSSLRARRLIAAGLAVLSFVLVMVGQREQGIVRDEVVYMRSGSHYARWWVDLARGVDGTLSERTITAHFGGPRPTDNNREHPPLMKTLFGFSRIVFADGLGWTTEVTAYRLPGALMNALLVALVFLFCARIFGTAEGLVAALLTLFLPRAFFHAGAAAFDAAIVTTWFATLYAYYLALRSRWWCVGLGVAFGLALATKHNAVMLPAVILAHYAWLSFRSRQVLGPRPLVFPALLLLGPLVLILLWPWLWFDTFAHARDWIGFHLNHVHYNFEYLGRNWNAPPFPWHVVIVTTLFTVPVATLAAGCVGAGVLFDRARRGLTASPERAPALLLFLSAGAAMGAILLPSTPIFGAEKHWAPAIPTICAFAGVGVAFAARLMADRLVDLGLVPIRAASRPLVASLALAAVATVVVSAAAADTAASRPYALSHYNALAGGAPGGADLGMNRQFWGYAARGALPYLNRFAPAPGEPAVPVYTHDASPAWPLYRQLGLLEPGLPDAGHEVDGIRRSRLALVVHELHFNRHDYLIWREYGSVQPSFVLTARGVPIVSVYAR